MAGRRSSEEGSKLNAKEQEKANILRSAIMGKTTNAQAAKQLRISVRQVQRSKAGMRKAGENAVIHKLKGKISNHAFSETEKTKAIETIKQKYNDFKPGFVTEKLQTIHDMQMTSQTIRVWMTEAGIWRTRKQKITDEHRSWRPRKEYFGELQQFDGSYHLWFEKRFIDQDENPIETCLLAAIDDATGRITKATFAANEGVVAVFTFWKEYAEEWGKTLAIYLDKFSTYKINHKAAVDNHDLMTQFERAMQDLSIYLIFAHSPQAKGRIERLFGTLQDRLVKEMRLANINTPDAGNKFLKEVFIPKFNDKFAVAPAKAGDVHNTLTDADKKNINRIFSIQSERIINNDFTIQFKNKWYQLAEVQETTVRAKEKVLVEEWLSDYSALHSSLSGLSGSPLGLPLKPLGLDKSIHFNLREKYLSYTELPERPKKVNRPPLILTRQNLNWKPPKDHPWRKPYKAKK